MRKLLYKTLILIFCISLSGCATVGIGGHRYGRIQLIDLVDFCSDYNLTASYLPFFEEIILSNKDFKVRLKEGYSYAVVNDKVKNMYKNVQYGRGQTLIPSSLGMIIGNFKSKTVKPVDSLISIKINTIVLDPGHGGKDPGAISPWGMKEKDINLEISKHLAKILKAQGFRVYLTRTKDRFISLENRVHFASKKKADLFISVHANSNRARKMKGLEVYYLSEKFSDTQSKILATAENLSEQRGFSLPSSLKSIIGEMINSEHRQQTLELAKSVLKSAENRGIDIRKVIGAPFHVLKYNTCPAVLVEVGYLTNYNEARLLKTPLYRQQLAEAIAGGVNRLRDLLDKKMLVESE